MADFFSRLAERALGSAQLVRPNLPSIFTPAPTIETAVQVIVPPGRAASFAAQSDTPQGVADSTLNDKSEESRAPQRQPTKTRRRPVASPAPVEDASQVSAENVGFAAAASAPTWQNFAADPQRDHAISSARAERESRAAIPAAETFASERSHPAPAVQVTIGRVEVRAVTPVAPARIAERKSPPLRSLDQYLRARNEGRR